MNADFDRRLRFATWRAIHELEQVEAPEPFHPMDRRAYDRLWDAMKHNARSE